jgi:methylmalonyl-CoA mutase
MKIEEAAARKQGRIDSKKDVIVGVNKYKLDQEDPIDILEVDNSAVRQAQISRLEQLRAQRDNTAVQEALDRLTEAVKSGESNLMELSVEAARRRATLGPFPVFIHPNRQPTRISGSPANFVNNLLNNREGSPGL